MAKGIKFGTDGWRSIIADDFTFDNVELVTKAICGHLFGSGQGKKGLFIGYDNRFLSEDFAQRAAETIAREGINVFLASVSVPTPLTAFMVKYLQLDGALMFTASHNPPRYNGIKFIPYYAGPADQEITQSIEDNLSRLLSRQEPEQLRPPLAEIKKVSDFSSYIDQIMGLIDADLISEAKPRVAIDTMYGSGSMIFPRLINEKLGLAAPVINNWRDPLFGGKLPDPNQDNLGQLYQIIQQEHLDLGLALDGDADRFGAIDAKGKYISPNNVICIILYYLARENRFKNGDTVVRTVATTHLVDKICKDFQLEVKETPVGFKYIGQAMVEGNVLIGGEESGGLSINGHIPEKDGLLANLLLLEIQSYINIKGLGPYLSDYLGEIYARYGTFYNTRLDLNIPEDKKAKVMDFFRSLRDTSIGKGTVTEINSADGIKLLMDKHDSWLLIRPSGTEPLIRCYIETTDQHNFNLIKNFVEQNINNLIK